MKNSKTRKREYDGRHRVPEIPPVSRWSANDNLLTHSMYAFAADSGTPVRDASCIICDKAISGQPFVIHFLTSGDVCPVNNNHLQSAAVMRHATCAKPGDVELSIIIANATHSCFGF